MLQAYQDETQIRQMISEMVTPLLKSAKESIINYSKFKGEMEESNKRMEKIEDAHSKIDKELDIVSRLHKQVQDLDVQLNFEKKRTKMELDKVQDRIKQFFELARELQNNNERINGAFEVRDSRIESNYNAFLEHKEAI